MGSYDRLEALLRNREQHGNTVTADMHAEASALPLRPTFCVL